MRRKHVGIKWIRRTTITVLALSVFVITGFVSGVIPQWLDLLTPPGTATLDHGWNLILVNREYRIPADYEVVLTELFNGERVDERIYPELQAMFDAARADGVFPVVNAGYRTAEEQQRLLDRRISAYEDEGYSDVEAKKLAARWVADPGSSEHQLGLAVDIVGDGTRSADDDVYLWLAEHAHEYGFIQRYPPDKTEITGISNEPWHYRYVGMEAALEIYEKKICLEEYIALLESSKQALWSIPKRLFSVDHRSRQPPRKK